jgi:predicted MPP superfamily phosphohydrolase
VKLIWLTDIHLNFLGFEARMDFYQDIINASIDGLLISGDIAEAPSVSDHLKEMAKVIQKPIYFVLGNHDYYRGKVDSVRQAMRELMQVEPLLHWLPASGVQDLGNQTLLLGEDGWADGRYGDYEKSPVVLNDSKLIMDLLQSTLFGEYTLLEKMQQLADYDAEQLKMTLLDAIKNASPKKIIILTHVPPFQEVCRYRGEQTNDDFLPFYSSKITGEVIMQIVQAHPDIEFLVLCGHTHGKAFWHPFDNLNVKVGAAEYTYPEIQEVITIA